MVRIGIVTCSNTTQEACCCSFGCLEAARACQGAFERYRDRGGVEIVGIASCANCPTAVAPEKILQKIKPLALLGVEAIHLSGCMGALCPFKKKYAKLIAEAYPHIEVVEGTHAADEATKQQFAAFMKGALGQPKMSMANLIEQVAKAGAAQAEAEAHAAAQA